jgi:hypothetical protein
MNKWMALAVCAVAAAAVGIFAIWAFGIRDSTKTVGAANAAELRWATEVCRAIGDWEKEWVKTVVDPTQPKDPKTRVAVERIITRMRVLNNRLRADLDTIDPPTDRTRDAQQSIEGAPKVYARYFRALEPDTLLSGVYLGPPVHSRAGALNRIAVKAWLEISDSIEMTYFYSPYIGVAFEEADACDEVRRHSPTGR